MNTDIPNWYQVTIFFIEKELVIKYTTKTLSYFKYCEHLPEIVLGCYYYYFFNQSSPTLAQVFFSTDLSP